MRKKLGFGRTPEWLAGAAGIEPRYGDFRNRMLLAAQEDLQNTLS